MANPAAPRAPRTKAIPGTGKAPNVVAAVPAYLAEHPDYFAATTAMRRLRTVLAGADAVKAAGTAFLPSLHQQETEDYRRYVMRAVFFGATERTREALVGMLMRKTPELKTTEAMEAVVADVDLKGTPFNEYVRAVLREMTSLGRGGTLIDWEGNETGGRPYFAHYVAEDITNWDVGRVNGRIQLTLLTLRECGHELNTTTLQHEETTTFRVYKLIDGKAVVRVTKTTAGVEVSSTETELKRRGKALDFIPFVPETLAGPVIDMGRMPLNDMAEINLSHYRTSADLENGRHLAGLPTPWLAGFDPKEKLVMGTSHAWISESPEAKVGFLEFTGTGLGELKDALAEKQQQMAILGARMLAPEKDAAEAFDTVKMRGDAEAATLVNVAEATSACLSLALQIAAWWQGTAEKPGDLAEENFLVLPTEFVGVKMDGPKFTALVGGYLQGAVSWPTLFYNLQQAELYPDNWTQADEEAAMRTAPALTPPKDPNAPDPNADPNKPPGGKTPPAK